MKKLDLVAPPRELDLVGFNRRGLDGLPQISCEFLQKEVQRRFVELGNGPVISLDPRPYFLEVALQNLLVLQKLEPHLPSELLFLEPLALGLFPLFSLLLLDTGWLERE